MGANDKAAATHHPGTGPDARVEAVAGDMERDWEYLYGGRLGYAQHLLAAADQADREAGIHRVRVDDATVEKAARALKESLFDRGVRVYEWPDDEAAAYRNNGGFMEGTEAANAIRFQKASRAVLAAITEAES